MHYLFSFSLLIILVSSCSFQSRIIPLTQNTEYVNERLIGIESNNRLQLKANFEGINDNHFIYYVSINNRSNQSIDIFPSDFYYTTNTNTTKFRALEYTTIVQGINNKIKFEQTTNTSVGSVQLANSIADLITAIADNDKDLSKEEKLKKDLNREQEANLNANIKSTNDEETIRLYQLKEQLREFYLNPITLLPGQTYGGLIYFPKAQNRITNKFNITYSSNGNKIELPFGLKKR